MFAINNLHFIFFFSLERNIFREYLYSFFLSSHICIIIIINANSRPRPSPTIQHRHHHHYHHNKHHHKNYTKKWNGFNLSQRLQQPLLQQHQHQPFSSSQRRKRRKTGSKFGQYLSYNKNILLERRNTKKNKQTNIYFSPINYFNVCLICDLRSRKSNQIKIIKIIKKKNSQYRFNFYLKKQQDQQKQQQQQQHTQLK